MKIPALPLLFLFYLATSLVPFLHAQPANDNCTDAIPLTVFTDIAFSTDGATTDGPLHPGQPCFEGSNDSIYADIWYVFTAIADGTLEWTSCGTVDFDNRMAVYATDDACLASNDNLVACNDDCAPDFSAELSFFGVEGQTYYFRLGSYTDQNNPTTTGSGTHRLNVLTGPANDFCANAIAVELGTTQFGNQFAATDGPDHDDNPCENDGAVRAQSDIWYTFTAPYTGTAIWSTCNSANFDTGLAVYPVGACPPTAESLIACNDDVDGCDDFTSRLNFDIVEGESYLLRLGGYDGDMGTGFFNLTGLDVSTREPQPRTLVRAYPNPATDHLFVELALARGGRLGYTVTDAAGRVLLVNDADWLPAGPQRLTVDTGSLAAGLYFLRLQGEDGSSAGSVRFVVE